MPRCQCCGINRHQCCHSKLPRNADELADRVFRRWIRWRQHHHFGSVPFTYLAKGFQSSFHNRIKFLTRRSVPLCLYKREEVSKMRGRETEHCVRTTLCMFQNALQCASKRLLRRPRQTVPRRADRFPNGAQASRRTKPQTRSEKSRRSCIALSRKPKA